MFFFLLLLPFNFRRASSNLCDSFTIVFAQNSSIFHWAVHRPIAFSPGLKSHEAIRTAHWRTMASFTTPFFWRVRMRTNHLATKCNYYCWITNTVGVRGMFEESLWMFEESLWFLSQCCIGILWEETCCSVIDDKLQLKHASAAKKKWHEQE